VTEETSSHHGAKKFEDGAKEENRFGSS